MHSRALILFVLSASMVLVGCGGGMQEVELPSLHEAYGTDALQPGQFRQAYTMADGRTFGLDCTGSIQVTVQQGSAWSATVHRGGGSDTRCFSTGTMAGVVDADDSLSFTLTQGRWDQCTAVGPGQYTGHLDQDRFYATGTTRVVCDDGSEGTVQEIMSAYPPPSGDCGCN